jgi:D-serine deaminase-like pyridoxal phosphate-dependent protein
VTHPTLQPWPPLLNEADVPSPALLLDLAAIDENLRRMVAIAGGPERLRPHVKTHKLPQLIERQLKLCITKFKASTIAEAEMTAAAGAREVLLAMPLVGPAITRFLKLQQLFPATRFTAVADDAAAVSACAEAARAAGQTIEVLLDLDVGQHRTGIAPGPNAAALYQQIANTAGIVAGGMHAYDGHLHQSDLAARTEAATVVANAVLQFKRQLETFGLPIPRLVMGGTPTFPCYAKLDGVECSPGTCVLWDAGYAEHFPDLAFLNAAALLARVISRPGPELLCLDLGHKAVASEMPQPRVVFPALPDAQFVAHNEEHLVLRTPRADEFPIGTALYGIPWHICPTVALHGSAYVVEDRRVTAEWPIIARARKLSV